MLPVPGDFEPEPFREDRPSRHTVCLLPNLKAIASEMGSHGFKSRADAI